MCDFGGDMKKLLSVSTLISCFVACASFALVKPHCVEIFKSGECSCYEVSMIELISNPEQYHGKPIQVTGFVKIEFEGTLIYLHREDYEQMLLRNAIWLEVSPEKYEKFTSGGYGVVKGIFNADLHGHMSRFNGAIGSITDIKPWKSRLR